MDFSHKTFSQASLADKSANLMGFILTKIHNISLLNENTITL